MKGKQQMDGKDWLILYLKDSAHRSIGRLANLAECALDVIRYQQTFPAPQLSAQETLQKVETLICALHAYALLQMETFERSEPQQEVTPNDAH